MSCFCTLRTFECACSLHRNRNDSVVFRKFSPSENVSHFNPYGLEMLFWTELNQCGVTFTDISCTKIHFIGSYLKFSLFVCIQ